MTESPQTPEEADQALEPAPVEAAVEPATEVTPPAAPEAQAPAPEPPPVAPAPPPPPPVAPAPPSLPRSDGAAGTSGTSDRPEIAVGAAFAGGFVLAMILKRLAR